MTGAELAARITAAAAVLGDFRRAEVADADWNGQAMPWATWADRLASMLGAVLDVASQAPALTPQQRRRRRPGARRRHRVARAGRPVRRL